MSIRLMVLSLVGSLGLGILAGCPQNSYGSEDGNLKQRLNLGEIVHKTKQAKGSDSVNAVVYAVVDAPPEHVWAVVSDCATYTESMYRVIRSRLLEKDGDRRICEVTVSVPGPIPNLTAVTEAVHTVKEGRWQRSWKLMKGDYLQNEGSWTLESFGGNHRRTLVVYRVLVAPKLPIPSVIARWAQNRSLPEVIVQLRKVVASKLAKKP